jgi:diacylglycerol kinase (ATP)
MFNQAVIEFFKTRSQAFRYAFAGWWFVIRTQRNAWIHALASILALTIGFWLRLPARDWAVIILAMAMVWIAAASAAVVGFLIMGPPLWQRLHLLW